MKSRTDRVAVLVAAASLVAATPLSSQDRGVSYTLYGTPGLIEMPTATSAADGQIAGSLAFAGKQQRTTFTFQITPRLSGSFRFSGIDEYLGEGRDDFYDRSFDLRFRFLDESDWMPAVAVGLQDFIGTGVFSGEYLVATKTLSDSVRVSAGLGWGRFGSYNGFSNPLGLIDEGLEDRPALDFAEGGKITSDQWFRGDAALFGGVEWAIDDQFTVKAEYSSDSYSDPRRGIEHESPFNFGLTYAPSPSYQFMLSYLHGAEIAFGGTILLNPNDRPFDGGFDDAPPPVVVRGADARAAQSWDRGQLPEPALRAAVQRGFAAEGLRLDSLAVDDRQARVRYTNERYRAEAQGLGRAARVLTRELPPSVETITLEPMQRGVPLSAVTLTRSDMEALENEVGGSDAILSRAVLSDAGGSASLVDPADKRDRFAWGLSPYGRLTLFSGKDPYQLEVGAELSARYEIAPNLILSGAIRKQVLGNDVDATPQDPLEFPDVPVVRRDAAVYADRGDPGIEFLTLAHYGRPGPALYSRVTVGYLEWMFGGVSTEVLWKPVESRLALGAELNYVQQRDYDLMFGFRDYDVVTGHASAYYDFDNGFHGRVDVGRYLAGDWGATFALDREFENGWRVGAYATLTDIPFDQFGEGSFDKGIRISIPTDFILGQPTRRSIDTTLQSLTRDGGARLDVEGRLYDQVRGGHLADLEDGWGRFWR